jgi:hypothetical protein
MVKNSNFVRGFDGVYTGELQWGHISLFYPTSLAEITRMVGYKDILFNSKGGRLSPYSVPDIRPASDRDAISGNIFADLIK